MAATTSPTSRPSRAPSLAKYEILEELGHGGMATVYRAHDRRLARDVAVKVLHPHLRDSSEIAHRFSTEARAVAKLRHPNIVEVYDVSSEEDEEQYLVVELLRGLTLRKVLGRLGPLPPEIAALLGVELAGALAHAHACDVVHRDVRPENVILEHVSLRVSRGPRGSVDPGSQDPSGLRGPVELPATNGQVPPEPVSADDPAAALGVLPAAAEEANAEVRVKLTDFGIAKLLDAQGVTSTGQVLGSPAHMAPEQIEGAEVDERTDVFGLGVLLYECMTGHLPFEGTNPAQVLRRVLEGEYPSAERERPVLGKAYSDILDRALAHDPDDRFSTMGEMKAALEGELARMEVSPRDGELARFFQDAKAYVAQHEVRVVARLKELGRAAHRAGDVHAQAAAYNRALAYRPQDPELLRVVTRMRGREERAAMLRLRAPPLLVVAALGVASFFVARALKKAPEPFLATPPSAVATADETSAPEPAPPQPSGPVEVASARVHIPLQPVAARSARAKELARRDLVIANVRPAFGVKVAVDGQPAVEATLGTRLSVDERTHELFFTCVDDVCEAQKRSVPASEKEEALSIEMRIKDAELSVEGAGSYTYQITQRPGTTFRDRTRVTMTRGAEPVTVVELETGVSRQATLKAGKMVPVSFVGP